MRSRSAHVCYAGRDPGPLQRLPVKAPLLAPTASAPVPHGVDPAAALRDAIRDARTVAITYLDDGPSAWSAGASCAATSTISD
ncbi:MAG: hypothetical protein J2P48_03405 [Alphaproteobacteria bacterium]|nr:hypothetical protein [Alphaproteobacteria bacterium]